MKPERLEAPKGELRQPCRWCQQPTLVTVLNHLGARCQRCFDAYCAAAQPPSPVPDGIPAGPRAWAHALKAREEGGERLSRIQRQAWRDALAGAAAAPSTAELAMPAAAVPLPAAIPLPALPRRHADAEAEYEAMAGAPT